MPRCAWCAAVLAKPKRGPFPTYCAALCRVRSHQDRNPDAVARYREVQNMHARKPRAIRACPYRSTSYEVAGRSKRATCGAERCRKAYRADSVRPYLHERRARIRSSRVERFAESEIFERDGWACGICGAPVDRAARFPDPLTPSLDHVVPVSLGGAHTRDNVRCSHLGCNLARGNRAA